MKEIALVETFPTIRSYLFLALLVVLVVTLSISVIRGDWKGAGVALTGAVVCAFFSNADRFEFFKFSPQGGLEARIVVAEAKDATVALRDVAVAAAEAIVTINGGVSNGGMALMPAATQRDQTKQRLLDLLKSMKASEIDLKRVAAADRQGVIDQYSFSLQGHIFDGIPKDQTGLAQAAIKLLKSPVPPDQLLKLRSDFHAEKGEVDEILTDFETYLRTGQHETSGVWARRDDWFGQ